MALIQLLSSPRNLSTALMYGFAQHPEVKVIDEPFYALYLNQRKDVLHPGKEDILNAMPIKEEVIINEIKITAQHHRHVFIKNMCSHMNFINWSFLEACNNILYIRDPALMLSSYSKVVEKPDIHEIGLLDQYEQFLYMKQKGIKFSVLDSGELLKAPAIVLAQLCNSLEINYCDNMLNWPKGGIEEDGIWAKYWYANVHDSTGFQKKEYAPIRLSAPLQRIYDKVLPYYEEMYNLSIKAV